MQAGKIKCPNCKKVLTINSPSPIASSPTAHPTPAQRVAPAANAPVSEPVSGDPFADLPAFGATPANQAGGNSGFGFPSAPSPGQSLPQGAVPAYRGVQAAPTAKQSNAAGNNRWLKVLGIVGGVIALGISLCVVGVLGLAFLGTRHSGWSTEESQGYKIGMPAGDDRRRQSKQTPLTTIHELSALRKETGSQYSLLVARVPAVRPDTTVESVIRKMQMVVLDERPVTRNGVDGVAGRLVASLQGAEAAEAEIFLHDGNLVVAMYSAYSKIRFAIGGTRDPRKNERELDKPDEFFDSLQLRFVPLQSSPL